MVLNGGTLGGWVDDNDRKKDACIDGTGSKYITATFFRTPILDALRMILRELVKVRLEGTIIGFIDEIVIFVRIRRCLVQFVNSVLVHGIAKAAKSHKDYNGD